MLNRNRKWVTLETLFGFAIAIGVLLRLINLGTRELWYDEVLSLLLSTGGRIHYTVPDSPIALSQLTPLLMPPESATKTLQNLLRGLYGGEPHPPLFFLAQHFWLRFGNSEIAMRSLPALWSLGAIAAAYGFGRKLLNDRAGLLFAALLATNPFFLFHSLNVRMYTPLVLWAILSVWALIEMIDRPRWKWQIVFVLAIAAGLLTFYLFAYWVVTIAVLILMLDQRRRWQHGLRLGSGVALTLPWFVWGTLKQLKNADLDRFSTRSGNPALLHLQDLLQTIGVHLIVGDWITSLPRAIALLSGAVAGFGLIWAAIYLWRSMQKQILTVGLGVSIFPLLLAFSVDSISGKCTLGFGWGRALIFVLPGCLLMIAIAIHHLKRWREIAAIGLLLLYLTIDIGDLSLRSRSVFRQIAAQLDPATPTLIALDSKAWGHVNRLAYYTKSNPVDLLAQPIDQLGSALEKALTKTQYRQVLWLESADPVWSRSATEVDRQQIAQILAERFSLQKTQTLRGTMSLDQFQFSLYTLTRETNS